MPFMKLTENSIDIYCLSQSIFNSIRVNCDILQKQVKMDKLLFQFTAEEFRNEIKNILSETIREQFQEKEANNEPEYLTRKETAKKFHISLVTLHRLTKDGIIKAYQIGGRVLYKAGEIDQSLTEMLKKHRR